MRSRTRFTRGLALASCGALASGLAFLPAGPASAAPTLQVYVAQGSSSANSACSVTSGDSFSTNGPNPLHHGHGKGAVNLSTTWTNGSDSSDVSTVTGHYGGKTRVVKKNGGFRSATLSGSGHLSFVRALGKASTCAVSGQLVNAVETVTKQPSGWYYVTRKTTNKNSLTETIVAPGSGLGTTTPVLFEIYQGGPNKVTERAYVSHGTYVTALVAGIEGGAFPLLLGKNGGTISRGSTTNSMSAVFRNAGSALSKAKGRAAHFVKLPGSVSCSHHSATLTWSSSAAKVASSAFFVNGKKKASVSRPKAGHRVVLRHLGPKADNSISVKLSLKGGGSASAAATYVPCHD